MLDANKIRPLVLRAGANVFQEDDPGNGQMYFVFSGEIEISKLGIGHLRSLKQGHFFGEMALIKNIARTATATVVSSDAKLGVIDKPTFAFLAKTNPKFLSNLIGVVATRAARAMEKIERRYV